MNTLYLLMGGNIGDRLKNLETAAELLQQKTGKIIKRSSVYETAAWGKTDQPDFLNQVLVIETRLSPSEYIQQILVIENNMGRVRTGKNAARIIDLDILFFNNNIIHQPHLTIPHPQIQNRKFVLIPLNELSPNLIHPVLNQPVSTLLSACKDPLKVRLVG